MNWALKVLETGVVISAFALLGVIFGAVAWGDSEVPDLFAFPLGVSLLLAPVLLLVGALGIIWGTP